MRNRDFPRFPSLSRGKALLENCVVLQFFDVASYKTQEALQAIDWSGNNGVDPSPAHSRPKFKRNDGLRGRECRLRWSGEVRGFCVWHVGRVYPPTPTATLHPIVGQQSQISWMKLLQWAEITFLISLQSQKSGFHASTVFNTTRPHLRTRSFPFPVVASTLPPSFSLYIGFEVQRSRTRSFVFFLEMLPRVKSRAWHDREQETRAS